MTDPPRPAIVVGTKRRPLTAGRLIFDEADELAVVVPASCRRTGRCHECVVEVRAGADQLSPRTPAEAFLRPGYRLACQAQVERADHDVDFRVLRHRLRIQLAPDVVATDLDPAVTVVGGRVVADDGTDLGAVTAGPLVGVAIDIGTTTVVQELVELSTGALLAVAAFENPQIFGGSDVIARVSYDAEVPGELARALRRAINFELRALTERLGLRRTQLVEAVVVGNPTMRDLAFGIDVGPLGQLPFRSVTEVAMRDGAAASTTVMRRAHEVGFLLHPMARVIGGPIVASHVGADIAADLVAVGATENGARERGRPFMLVDIGTNTEVVVSDGQRLVAASGPAGPAFEGGGVGNGMAGAEGAIERVRFVDGRFEVGVIGDGPADGICGSGLVDLLAELRAKGGLLGSGRFADGRPGVPVLPERNIALSRADIGHLAVAKAATAVGQRVLLRRLGLAPSDLDRLYLAGGFANALDAERAVAIGLLVPAPRDRIVPVGNASIAGARALLLSRRRRAELEALVQRIEHVELEAEPDFLDLFTDGCLFEPIPVG